MGSSDENIVVAHVGVRLGNGWTEYPGGWPNQIEAALIDAVLGIRARYGHGANSGTAATGVPAAVGRWIEKRGGSPVDDLEKLASVDADALATTLKNHQVLSGKNPKASAIVQAANNFVDIGVRHSSEFKPDDVEHQKAYLSVRGLGPVTWNYFCMLLGAEKVKPDTWIVRFVEEALGRNVSPEEAEGLMMTAAQELGVSPRKLDHAIWAAMRTSKR